MKKRVAVAMSGGVDSSVAAAVLKEDGYDVFGITMKHWDYEAVSKNTKSVSRSANEFINTAKYVSEQIGIPHYTLNLTDVFEKKVINHFVKEYLSGRTPNPCAFCNVKIKWGALLKKAVEIGADYFATGHYARIEFDNDSRRYILKKGKDKRKEQSYFLWRLSQNVLKKTILPLGEMTKEKVRKYAHSKGFKTAKLRESQEICFIPDNDYHRFLNEWTKSSGVKIKEGEITAKDGTVLGQHKGHPFYTIGQRKKLGIAVGRPVYVYDIESESNRIFVGDEEDLYSKGLIADNINIIALEKIERPVKAVTKIRYNDCGTESVVYPVSNNEVRIIFDKKKKSITPGQSAVFYQNDSIVGGGVIKERIN